MNFSIFICALGFLNTKERILDTVLTNEGYRQLANGKMQIKFAAFSDASVYYESDEISGSSDASTRVYFEAASRPKDQVSFESDDSGNVIEFSSLNKIKFVGGSIVSGSTTVTASVGELASDLLGSSITAFKSLMTLSTEDLFFGKSDFELSENNIDFIISDNKPFGEDDIKSIVIENAENLFDDGRLVRADNFKFLPPVNTGTRNPLGNFKNKRKTDEKVVTEQIVDGLSKLANSGHKKRIKFIDTSRENNLVCQFFSVETDKVKKLELIDFGDVLVDGSLKRMFFCGKVFIDGNGIPTYTNIFTLVFGYAST